MTKKELEKMADKLLEGSEGILTKSRMQTIYHNEVFFDCMGSGSAEEDELHTAFSNVDYILHPNKKSRAARRKAKETQAERELRELAEAETNPKAAKTLWSNYWNSEIRNCFWRRSSTHTIFYSNSSLSMYGSWSDGNNLQLEPVVIKELLKMDIESVRETEVGRELEQIVKENCNQKQRTAFYAKLCGYKNKEIEAMGIGWSVKTVDHFFNHGLPALVKKVLKRQEEEDLKNSTHTKLCSCCKRELPLTAFYVSSKSVCKECKRKKQRKDGVNNASE